MNIFQYYTDNQETKDKIIALAELLGCQYRTVEDIIAVQVDSDEALARLKRSKSLPWVVQRGDC
jgi:hypothetical protein